MLIAHERTKTLEPGWYMGKIKLFGVSPVWKRVCPSANFLIKYTKKDTDNTRQGDEARELTDSAKLRARRVVAVAGFCLWVCERFCLD